MNQEPSSGWPGFAALTWRELVRFVRQPSRPIATLGTAVLMWVFLTAGFGQWAGTSGAGSYGSYLLPGMVALTAVFTSVFGAISLIDDRHAGFLQSVLSSPLPRWSLVASKIAGGTLIATAQAAVLLPAAFVVDHGSHAPTLVGFALGLVAIACMCVGLTGVALAAAWRVDSVQGFHGVMNVVLMPMWLLSGAFVPLESAAGWMRVVMLVNPLTWPTAALRGAFGASMPASAGMVWGLTLAFAIGGVVLATATIGRRNARA